MLQISGPPQDNIFQLMLQCQADPNPEKIDLAPGIYKTEEGAPFLLPCVAEARQRLLSNPLHHHEYGPVVGLPKFLEASEKLVFSEDFAASSHIASVQTLSGTGACHMAALWLAEYYDFPTPTKDIFIPKETWFNHYAVFKHAGLRSMDYPYFDPNTLGLAFDAYCETIKEAPNRSVFVLHACAHNPTGIDPTEERMQQLAKLMKSKDHLVIFDAAYLGFRSGSVEKDRRSIEIFFKEHQVSGMVCVGFGKNFGLYGERVGALHVLCPTVESKNQVAAQLLNYNRWEHSGPPRFGAEVVELILNDAKLKSQWYEDLKTMSTRIRTARQALYKSLQDLQTPGNWKHVIEQEGMFTYSGLTPKQCRALLQEFSIYLPESGRISMTGVNQKNAKRIAERIDEVVRRDVHLPN